MFNDHKDNQTSGNTDMDHVASDISGGAPTIGLGVNPSTFSSPILPTQSTTTAPQVDSASTSPSLGSPIIAPTSSAAPGDLDEIKNQALEQLSPLVSKLEQSPEDRYKTLMMLIQASDNHDLIKEAYEAANAIEDEHLKAEALLGIVNEINYFTQKHSS